MRDWFRLFDAFRVSTSLCRFIFESPKVNDALLFMTILSTDLKALKRRGYNSMLLSKRLVLFGSLILKIFTLIVDRILRQQKAEREAAERAHRASLVSSSETLVQDTQTKIPATGTMISPPPTPIGTAARQTTGTSLEQILKRPTSAISDLGRFLRPNRPSTSSRATSPPRGDDATQSSILDAGGVSPPPNLKGASLQPSNGQGLMRSPNTGGPNVTPLSNICTFREPDAPKRYLIFHSHLANNIDMAIKACAPERSNLLRNREEMQMVRETLDEGYCDVSGRAGELNLVGMCPVPLCEPFPVSHHGILQVAWVA
jgi:hypothetical protein